MKRRVILFISFIFVILSCIILYLNNKILEDENKNYEILQNEVSSCVENIELNFDEKRLQVFSNKRESFKDIESKERVILNKFSSLYAENNDLVGWISNNDLIDYPIMQCNEDSNFYLHKDFYKNESISGSIYIPNDITIDDKLVMIYGHNMKNNSMFGTLDYYLNEDYFNEHKNIKLSSLYVNKKYEVLAVFVSKIYTDNYNGFKYYNYRGNITEDEFNTYKSEVSSLIKVGNIDDLSYDDNIVELITCWYSEKDARLVVLCREISE